MPVHITRTPMKNLIFPGEKLSSSKDGGEDDIQAIRMYRTAPDNLEGPSSIVGSDIFIIEEAIKAKLADYSRMEVAADAALTASIAKPKCSERVPMVSRGNVRKMHKVFYMLSPLIRITSSV